MLKDDYLSPGSSTPTLDFFRYHLHASASSIMNMLTVMFPPSAAPPGWIANWRQSRPTPRAASTAPRQIYVGPAVRTTRRSSQRG